MTSGEPPQRISECANDGSAGFFYAINHILNRFGRQLQLAIERIKAFRFRLCLARRALPFCCWFGRHMDECNPRREKIVKSDKSVILDNDPIFLSFIVE